MESNTNINNNNNNNEEEDNLTNNDLNNSWDGKKKEYDFVHDLEFTEDLKQEAIKIINEDNILLNTDITNQNKNWEKFYKFNKTNFFQDRHYILKEFIELNNDIRPSISLLDMGCGVGNSFYPLIKVKNNLIVYAFDFSNRAINNAKTHKLYEKNKDRIFLKNLDLVNDEIDYPSCDYGILMFVLSAINPEYHEKIIEKISNKINKDGIVFFRDYAKYDMAQIRFAQRKKNKVNENLYMRKDKTLSYFFDQKEIENLFNKYNFQTIDSKLVSRVIENRKENKKMHRLWLQIKFKKE
jgi:2-polyprenyl-3-methyl-5-hydroxy-6-metoxy-1,4-benzoquinol methylase